MVPYKEKNTLSFYLEPVNSFGSNVDFVQQFGIKIKHDTWLCITPILEIAMLSKLGKKSEIRSLVVACGIFIITALNAGEIC